MRVSGQVRSSSIADIALVPETFLFGNWFTTKTAPPDGKFEIQGVIPGVYRLRAHIKVKIYLTIP